MKKKNASENEVINKENNYEIFTNNMENEDKTQDNVKDNFSDINVEKTTVVEQTSPVKWNNFQDDSKISEHQVSSSTKTGFPDQALYDNLHLLQDIFDRIVVECCQKKLTCRLLHTKML